MRKIIFLSILLFSSPTFATTIKEVKTDAGITAWLVEEHSQPLISVGIAFRDSGTAYDPDGKDGQVAMVSALILEGAGDMDAEAFSKALENSAVRLNFSAADDGFYGSMETLSEHKEKAFNYLGLALTNPRFDDAAMERVKKQTLSAIKQMQEKPAYKLSRAWQKQIFGDHPYSKPEIGTEATVQNISKQDLRDFMGNYLTRENIIVSVVGDINEQELKKLLDDNLGKLPAKYKPQVKLVDITLPTLDKQIVIEQDIPQTIVRFGMNGLKRADPEYITGFVMNYMLGGAALTSRLGVEIREKRGLAYSASSALTPLNHAAIFEGSFSTRNEKVGEAITTLKQTLTEFAKDGVSEEELAEAKRFLTGSFIVGLDSNSSIVNFITMMQLQNLGIDYMDKRNSLIKAVTRENVNVLAKKLIQLDKLQLIMVGKPVGISVTNEGKK